MRAREDIDPHSSDSEGAGVQPEVDRTGSGTKQHKRSRNGCNTCRAKKVKCDEQRPECGRCSRLRLPCDWENHRPSLRERRRGRGSIRSRTDWKPDPIVPRTPGWGSFASIETDTTAVYPPPADIHAHSPDQCHSLARAAFPTPESLHGREPSHQLVAPTQPLAVNDGSVLGFENHSLLVNDPFSAPLSLMPSWDEFCASWPTINEFGEGLAVNTFPAATMPSYPLNFPSAMALTPLDHRALEHYSTTYSVSFTRKTPKWSTPNLVRTVAQNDPMLMHFLLAVSLQDMWCRSKQLEDELQFAANQHYIFGTNLLAKVKDGDPESPSMPNLTTLDHVQLLASFWLLYLYKVRTGDVDVKFLRQLSSTVADHIRLYKLDVLCSSSSLGSSVLSQPGYTTGQSQMEPSGQMLNPATCSARDGALIALMMICVYFQDIKSGFYHCGGQIATHLNSNKVRLGRIYDLARNALALYWGADYPMNELVEDSENYSILKFHSEMNILLEDINCEFASSRPDVQAHQRFSDELARLRGRYENVLGMASEDFSSSSAWGHSKARSGPPNRTQINADTSSAYFHAVRIYLFRCTLEDPTIPSPPDVESCLNAVIQITGRVFQTNNNRTDSSSDENKDEDVLFHRMEWPLFIAGAETKDSIYQDWIVQKMYRRRSTQRALQKIIEEQSRTGRRVGVEFMRKAFLPADVE
ncbi:uncharacterized protein N7459_003023 [Penicillium hispanicum]|uniref:uncharacterized protein n=1 Tax=Penicillium hispanicum TaxID=1080232 RepID=UPI00253F76F5|nr:uncharacterized protein N7459_003023 [Penicillium hispanicum]KAJ5587258.1 hypothetical protein N7459_003023 [Penicillium hispanicum]